MDVLSVSLTNFFSQANQTNRWLSTVLKLEARHYMYQLHSAQKVFTLSGSQEPKIWIRYRRSFSSSKVRDVTIGSNTLLAQKISQLAHEAESLNRANLTSSHSSEKLPSPLVTCKLLNFVRRAPKENTGRVHTLAVSEDTCQPPFPGI